MQDECLQNFTPCLKRSFGSYFTRLSYCRMCVNASGVHRNLFSGGGGFSPGIFSGGVQQIQLTEGRENGDLGAVAP
jgi:hypothetical protein